MVTPPVVASLGRRLAAAVGRDLAGFANALRSGARAKPGLYHYRVSTVEDAHVVGRSPDQPTEWDGQETAHDAAGGSRRLHLRVGADGSGLLMVDAADVIHLNATAVTAAKGALDGRPQSETVRAMRSRFSGVATDRLESEIGRIYAMVRKLRQSTDGCITCNLTELDHTPLYATRATAPYKADLALTYGCNNACGHCYNEPGRKGMPTLGIAGWRRVLRKLATVGIPHVIFTGGEPTLFRRLPDVVSEADRLDMITGLNTNGRLLGRGVSNGRSLAQSLARAGLSHVQVTLQSHRADVHNAVSGADSFHETVAGIENALDAGLYTITNTTLTRRNAEEADRTVEFIASLGLQTMAVNSMIYSGDGRTDPHALDEDELAPLVSGLRDRAAELGMRLLWYTPTDYCRLSPVELDLGPKRCNAAEYSIAVEPNGDVLPCQSYYRPAGNILRDRWASIWDSRLFRSFRDRTHDAQGCGLPEKCWDCCDLSLCGGGCRLQHEREEVLSAEKGGGFGSSAVQAVQT